MSLRTHLNDITRAGIVAAHNRLLQRQHQLSRLLLTRAKKDQTRPSIDVPLITRRTTTGALSSPYETYPETGRELGTVGNIDWTEQVAVLQVTGFELRTQHGINITQLMDRDSLTELPTDKQQVLISTINTQISRAEEDLAWSLGKQLYAGIGVGGQLTGLPVILDSTGNYLGKSTSDSIFDTDDVTSNSFWTPHVDSNSGTNRQLTLERLATNLNKIRRGGEKPEDVVVIMNNDMWSTLEIMLQGQQYFRNENPTMIGFNSIEWRNATFMADEMCPANRLFGLNMNHLWYQIHPAADLDNFQGWKQPHNQDVLVGEILTQIQLISNDRHRMFDLQDILSVAD